MVIITTEIEVIKKNISDLKIDSIVVILPLIARKWLIVALWKKC
jgi:hypothetical protein